MRNAATAAKNMCSVYYLTALFSHMLQNRYKSLFLLFTLRDEGMGDIRPQKIVSKKSLRSGQTVSKGHICFHTSLKKLQKMQAEKPLHPAPAPHPEEPGIQTDRPDTRQGK